MTEGVATTTSMRVANGTEVQHKNVLELIRNNMADFEEFGPIAFETRKGAPLEQGGFTKPTTIAILNEEHATLLLTYMRNSAVVRDFKKRLVRAFYELRRGVSVDDRVPQTLPDALRAYAREVEAREAAEAYVKELEPKAEYVDNFVSPDDCILFRTIASQLDMPETALRELLIEKKWIYKQFIGRRFSKKAGKLVDEYEWRAYAERRNYFRLFSQHNAPRHHNNQLRQTLYVTPPGAQAIRKLVGALAVTT